MRKFSLQPKRLVVAVILVSAAVTFGCESKINQPYSDTREVTDDLGRTVSVPNRIERAISLAPNLTEMIFAVGAGGKLVGVTTFCNYPVEAQQIRKVSDTQTPNIESIIALKPDIVFVSTASQLETFMQTLEAQKIAVYVTNPQNVDEIIGNLRQFGTLFQSEGKAETLISELFRRIGEIGRKVDGQEKVRIFVQISNEPLFTIGSESFLTEIIERSGGVSVTKDVATAYPKLSKETALALNPEAIILSDSDDNKEPNYVFKNSPAFRNGKIFRINADMISRPGPRLVDAMEQLATALHPEKF
ncbi:MAG: cobalamin-binding protein [Acidobacteriota bacterium]|nr:cobalamin-binding protein [Acidobacteriota bacterium]